ncbi:MAG TPA: hypothetical protein VMU89_14720 [Thermomicrobiaceae bacterium]|nr:hypothetical protein [Thermomicrobiaceae bacterium]
MNPGSAFHRALMVVAVDGPQTSPVGVGRREELGADEDDELEDEGCDDELEDEEDDGIEELGCELEDCDDELGSELDGCEEDDDSGGGAAPPRDARMTVAINPADPTPTSTSPRVTWNAREGRDLTGTGPAAVAARAGRTSVAIAANPTPHRTPRPIGSPPAGAAGPAT